MSNPTGKNQYSGRGRSAMAQSQRDLTAQNLREARRVVKQSSRIPGVLKSVQLMQAESDLHHLRRKRK